MKRNKRQSKFIRYSSTQKFMDFFKEYMAITALIIPIIPSLIFAGVFAYEYGRCYFLQIPLSAYLGLSNSNIVIQAILIFGIGIGVLSLNALGYIANAKNGIYAILLFILSPFVLSLLTFFMANTSDTMTNTSNFKILFNTLLPFFIMLSFISFLPGICYAIPDKKSIKKGHKYLLYDAWTHNKIFRYFLYIAPILMITFSLLFSLGYSRCFQINKLYFTQINGQEYAILYEGDNYYQLASSIIDKPDSPKKIILNHQMRVEKNNLEVRPYSIDLSNLFIDN